MDDLAAADINAHMAGITYDIACLRVLQTAYAITAASLCAGRMG